MTNSHPLAALIAGKANDARDVFDGTCDTAKQAVDYFEQLILAALEAATPPDLVEAGKVLEGVTPGPWKANYSKWEPGDFIVQTDHPCRRVLAKFDGDGDDPDAQSIADARFIAWCREGVPALIALATAQAAQIAGMQDPVAVHANTLRGTIAIPPELIVPENAAGRIVIYEGGLGNG